MNTLRAASTALVLIFGLHALPVPTNRILEAAQAGGGKTNAGEKPLLKKFALLVGCSKYEFDPSLELFGSTNDVRIFKELLQELGFQDQDIATLVGWPDDASKRPTCSNIKAAFESLIKKADEQTQVVILLGGHGTQIPIPEGQNPLDPKNFEPDGLDEVFLPADFQQGGPRGLKNIILDDEIGAWLTRLRQKGAHVWIVFDCCHSGTMDRAAIAQDLERPREVRPERLLPKKEIDAAVKRSHEAVAEARARGKLTVGQLLRDDFLDGAAGAPPNKALKGKVTAFFAAQPFETTRELPRPPGAPRTQEHYHGLLTYTLVKTLKQHSGGKLTYRELMRALMAEYASERGARGPTPGSDGDLDLEVLGVKLWPKRSLIVLKRDQSKLKVTTGGLQGLTPGSILSVHAPAGKKGGTEGVLGYVEVLP
jgi:hypothetical protein